jgi:hypothetical protein
METVESFRWGSLHGASVICFLLVGGLFCLGPVGAFFMPKALKDTRFLYLSDKADVVRFEAPPSELMERSPVLKQYRDTMLTMLTGFFGPIGVLILGVAWFGLRRGETWALPVLCVAWLAAMPGHLMLLLPYIRVDAPILMSLPPYWTFPSGLTVAGLVTGWLALK